MSIIRNLAILLALFSICSLSVTEARHHNSRRLLGGDTVFLMIKNTLMQALKKDAEISLDIINKVPADTVNQMSTAFQAAFVGVKTLMQNILDHEDPTE